MAIFLCNFSSEYLQGHTQVNIIIPPVAEDGGNGINKAVYADNREYPVLYLLHGYTGDESSWIRGSGIERYAEEHGMAVVMPDCGNSFYTDFGGGNDYFSYVTKELIPFIEKMFPVSRKREDRHVCGFSMGGYGAMKIGLSRPDLFASAATLSGALDINEIVKDDVGTGLDFSAIFGDSASLSGSIHDLYHLLGQNREELEKMRFYQACGTEDFLYEMNGKFRQFMDISGLDFRYEEGPGGHEWNFWDRYVQNVLTWIQE